MSNESCRDVVIGPEAIKESPLGTELTEAQCQVLSDQVSACGLQAGAFLLQEGKVDDSIHVIMKGTLEVVTATGGGEWVTLQVLREGDMVGELGFIDGVPHSAAIRALADTELFSLNRTALEALLKSDPQLVYQVMRAIIRTVHVILRRMNLQYVELTNYITKTHGRY
jgi:CRP/FNR family transcriptional regulator, cyclic AMP receptor protein